MGVLVLFASANTVVYKLLLNQYGEEHAYFVDQANNLLYVIVSFVVLLSTHEPNPGLGIQYKFMVMGGFDGLGTFLTVMGGSGTPGTIQNVLNQALIPVTMFLSIVVLYKHFSVLEYIGALFIVLGAALSTITSTMSKPSIAYLLYALSNVPMGTSAVYKEKGFSHSHMNVYVLTFWVSLYQLLISFAFAPIQAIIGMDIQLSQIPSQLMNGLNFSLADSTSLFLLLSYFSLNFVYSLLGLHVTKRYSAALCVVACTLRLPLVHVVLSTCSIMGSHCESSDIYMLLGLCVVVIGFTLYSLGRRSRTLASTQPYVPSSFQERVVGMGDAWREEDAEFPENYSLLKSPVNI